MDWTAKEQNGKITVTVDRPLDNSGLWRAYAVGPGGSRCLLGTLTPGGGRLSLRRVLSVDGLRQRGCYPIASVEAALAHSFSPAPPPLPGWSDPPRQLPWPDDLLSAAYAAAPKSRYQSADDGFTLAFPCRANGPFPMLPIFCFARCACLHGQLLWLFSFDQEGMPRFPAHNSGEL